MKSYRAYWKKLIGPQVDSYNDILAEDPFAEWKRLLLHEGPVEDSFTSGIELLCAGADSSLASKFFMRSVALADRAIAEEAYKRGDSKHFFPINRAKILRAKSYSELFLTGTLSQQNVRQSIDDILEWCSHLSSGDWESINQEKYLSAASMSLIIRDAERTQEFLKNWRSCSERSSHDALIRAFLGSTWNDAMFNKCFDKIRRPTNAELLTAFEMALLKIVSETSVLDKTTPYSAVTIVSA